MVEHEERESNILIYKDNDYYYERHIFLIDTEYYVNMVVISVMDLKKDEMNNEIARYIPIVTHSEELLIENLPKNLKELLLEERNIEEHYLLDKEEYTAISGLEGNELFSIDPTLFKYYIND